MISKIDLFEQKFQTVSDYFEKRFFVTVGILFLTSLVIRLLFTPFKIILESDPYIYLVKSQELIKGNFSPMLPHFSGWPFFMSPFLHLLGNLSIFKSMIYVRIISNLVGSLSIFPLAFIGRRLLDKKNTIYLLILFSFSSYLVMSAYGGGTDPLFTFLLLVAVCFILKATENYNYILISASIGALAYYVRVNGIFILVIIILSSLLLKKEIHKFKYKHILFSIFIFFLISAPLLYQRYVYFDSPFFYGPNSKYFVDNYAQVWSDNIPVPSLLTYLNTHSFSDYFNKFIINGFFRIIYNYIKLSYNTLSPILLLFFFYGFSKYFKAKKIKLLTIIFGIWILGITPVYHIFGSLRFLYPTIPFILIFTVIGLDDILKNIRYKNVFLSIFLIGFIIFSLVTSSLFLRSNIVGGDTQNDLEWGKWAANHIEGKIAIYLGAYYIMMHLPDTTVGGKDMHTLHASKSNLQVVSYGYFKDFPSAMDWFKKTGVTHFLVDENNIKARPYLKEIYFKKEVPPYLTEIYSNCHTNAKWKVRIFCINWSKYEKK